MHNERAMSSFSRRRRFLKSTTAAAAGLWLSSNGGTAYSAAVKPGLMPFSLGFSLYGMQKLPLAEALKTCADIGYRDVELALLAGFHADPTTFTKPARVEARSLLGSLGLRVAALMDNLKLPAAQADHEKNLERIKRAGELARDLSPDRPPVLETIMGGSAAEWDDPETNGLARLRDWSQAAKTHDLTIAVKAHANNYINTPTAILRLIEQCRAAQIENVKLVYDYSHFRARSLPLDETLQQMVDETAFIHVKDTRMLAPYESGKSPKFEFLLPGEGGVDYVRYFEILRDHNYFGSVTVEVSAQLHKKPDYDPIAAARRSFAPLKLAFDAVAAT